MQRSSRRSRRCRQDLPCPFCSACRKSTVSSRSMRAASSSVCKSKAAWPSICQPAVQPRAGGQAACSRCAARCKPSTPAPWSVYSWEPWTRSSTWSSSITSMQRDASAANLSATASRQGKAPAFCFLRRPPWHGPALAGRLPISARRQVASNPGTLLRRQPILATACPRPLPRFLPAGRRVPRWRAFTPA